MSANDKFDSFCDPNYSASAVGAVDPNKVRLEFDTFRRMQMAKLDTEGEFPKDTYMYATWMGEFHRQLDMAKDSYVKAALAFHSARGDGTK